MTRLAFLAMLALALTGCAAPTPTQDERIYYAVRGSNGMTLSEPDQSEEECMDVYGKTKAIEAVVPPDYYRHKVAAIVEKAENVRVYPPSILDIGNGPMVSSAAFVKVHGRQQFLECDLQEIFVVLKLRRLPEE